MYKALGWDNPTFAHIPLIHGPDGAKLSKRHGALGVDAYEEMGFLPEALCNYLLRLGWGKGDEEIIPIEKAIEWFDTDGIGKSASRFDIVKLTNFNGNYIREADDKLLTDLVINKLAKEFVINDISKNRVLKGMPGLKSRAKTIVELSENASFYVKEKIDFDEKSSKLLNEEGKKVVDLFTLELEKQKEWTEESLEACARSYSEKIDLKLGKLAQPIRAALTGRTISPSVFDIFVVLGKDESINRLKNSII